MPLEPAFAARVKTVFDQQRAHRWTVSKRSASERVAILRRLKAAVIERREAIAAAIFQDFRKPARETEITEIHPSIEELDHAIQNLDDWMAPRPVPGTLSLFGMQSEIRCEARGVSLILAPWNYPFFLLIPPLTAAIAAGNCVMLKPSEKAPATARAIADLIRATFEEREVAIFEGASDLAEALLELPFDHIFFTGSTRVGHKVMAAAAKHLSTVTLELGGKSPAFVDRSADLATAADRIAWGRFVNAGQTCVAPDYVWVHEAVERPFLEALRASVERAYGATEEARQQSPDFARIIDDQSFRRLQDQVERTVAGGAKVELGARFEASERYVAPTVLSDVSLDSPIMEDEIFGPVLPVLRYRQLEETYAFIERRGKPLALYLFGTDPAVTEHVMANTSAGGTVLNNVVLHLANPNLPFGGVGASGQGSYHGHSGFRAFSHERSVLRQGRPALSRLLFPPYRGRRSDLLARFLRALE